MVPEPEFTEEHETAPPVIPPEPTFNEVPVMAPKEPVPVVWIVPDPAFTEPVLTDALVMAPEASNVVTIVYPLVVTFCRVVLPDIQLGPAVTFTQANFPWPVVWMTPSSALRPVQTI